MQRFFGRSSACASAGDLMHRLRCSVGAKPETLIYFSSRLESLQPPKDGSGRVLRVFSLAIKSPKA